MTPEKIFIHKHNLNGDLLVSLGEILGIKNIEYIRKDIHEKAIAEERERCANFLETLDLSELEDKNGWIDVALLKLLKDILKSSAKAIRRQHEKRQISRTPERTRP